MAYEFSDDSDFMEEPDQGLDPHQFLSSPARAPDHPAGPDLAVVDAPSDEGRPSISQAQVTAALRSAANEQRTQQQAHHQFPGELVAEQVRASKLRGRTAFAAINARRR